MIFPLPEIDSTKPLYLYGAGMMGVSYKRQIEQLGARNLLRGFIEDQPAATSYLGIPVIKRSTLTERQLQDSQFLIASSRLRKMFENNLLEQGCLIENIIHPAGLAWNGAAIVDGVRGSRRVCVYSVVVTHDDLRSICNRVKKERKRFAAKGLDLEVIVVVDAALDFDASKYSGIELVRSHSRDRYPDSVLAENDIIVILNGNELAGIDAVYHDKVYFYGVSVLDASVGKSKRYLAASQPRKHRSLIKALQGRERIKVVFLAIHCSVWKVDPVFRGMLASPLFDPLIVVCPYVSYGEERMWEDMRQSCEYFAGKGYPFVSAYNRAEQRWLNLKEICPDIVFFTNPHNLTRREYYQDAYLSYLSCYVPYHYEVGRYGGDVAQYDQDFHNALWKIFTPHAYSSETYKRVSKARGANTVLAGYPAMEALIEKQVSGNYPDVWKSKDERRRIIWAPHHTITDSALPYANFLRYAQDFKALSASLKDRVVWSFKPHPLLKSKLYQHADWGREKTDAYYEYWALEPHTQLDEGEYTDLFLSADAMIHDSGSFLAEFLYVEKPVLYLLSENNQGEYYSGFGLAALEACEIGYCFDDVLRFVERLIGSQLQIKDTHRRFLETEIAPYFDGEMPSERIINEIARCLR